MSNPTTNPTELENDIKQVEGLCHISSAPYPMGVIESDTLLRICAAAKRVPQLEKENRELKSAANALTTRMLEVYQDERYQDVWFCYQNHGGDYSDGPTWTKEFEVLTKLL